MSTGLSRQPPSVAEGSSAADDPSPADPTIQQPLQGRFLIADRIRDVLPSGRSLPQEDWRRRHRALLGLLWLHAPAIVLFGVARGFGIHHSLLEGSVVAAIASFATLATAHQAPRKLSSGLVAFGLLSCSGIIIHISGGYIEAHFHFFVMMSLLLLYEDWFPYLLAFAYVVLHHGIAGTLDPTSVYNHPDAEAHPWKWAAIHGGFISAAGAANIIAWRLNERVRERSKLAYRQARENEERFRSAFDHAPIGVGLQALSGRWLQVNRALSQILGYSPEELVSLETEQFVHAEDRPADADQIGQLQAVEILASQIEKRYVHAKGHVVWCHVNVSLVRDERGRPLHFITQVEDITERKRTERYLEAQRAVASVLAGGGPESEVFPELLEALGQSMRWQLGMVWTRSDDPQTLRFQHLWRGPGVEAGAFETTSRGISFRQGEGLPGRIWATGEPAWIEDVTRDSNFPRSSEARAAHFRGAIGIPVFSGSEVYGVVEFFGDEPHRPDRDLMGTLRTISDQIGQFIERKRAEQEADRLKDEFVALVSHELRTPLTSILGYLDLVLEGEGGPLTDVQEKFLSVVSRNSRRLLHLVGDLLFIAQAENGKLRLELEDVDLAAIVGECGEAMGQVAADKGIQLEVVTEPVPPIPGDRGRLAQLLDNLVSNAVKFTPEGGGAELRLSARDDRIVVEVSDSGIGIPADELNRLFQRFFRASTATQHAIPGTGLGLAITKAIAEAHGAEISVSSKEGNGTTFQVEFPTEAAAREDGVQISPARTSAQD